jgi:hypothetical protein
MQHNAKSTDYTLTRTQNVAFNYEKKAPITKGVTGPHLDSTTIQVRIQNFFVGGGGDPEAIYNFYLILKIMLQKSCCKYNITLLAAAFMLYTYE